MPALQCGATPARVYSLGPAPLNHVPRLLCWPPSVSCPIFRKMRQKSFSLAHIIAISAGQMHRMNDAIEHSCELFPSAFEHHYHFSLPIILNPRFTPIYIASRFRTDPLTVTARSSAHPRSGVVATWTYSRHQEYGEVHTIPMGCGA